MNRHRLSRSISSAAAGALAVALVGVSATASQARAAGPLHAASAVVADDYDVPDTAGHKALPAGETVSIPVHGEGPLGADLGMVTQVFLPPGAGPFPVVVFSHGRPPGAAGRAALKQGVSRAQLRYWLAQGVAVVSPIRPGYGPSPGGDLEQSGVRHNSSGRCITTPDFHKTADAASRTVFATLDWLRAQRWADVQHVLLVGQSVGGLTSVAAGAGHPPGVVGYINFAGGSGGDPALSPGRSCDPGQITAMYSSYGKTTTLPNLWVYARNDQYWGPDEPVEWHDAFARGGSRTTFVHADPVPDGDGHGLSRHAEQLWAPAVNAWLSTIGFPPRAAARSATSASVAR